MMNDLYRPELVGSGKPVYAFLVSLVLHAILLLILYPFVTIRMSGDAHQGITVFLSGKTTVRGGDLQEKNDVGDTPKFQAGRERSQKKIIRPVQEVMPEVPEKVEKQVSEIAKAEKTEMEMQGGNSIDRDDAEPIESYDMEQVEGSVEGVQTEETAGGEEPVYGIDRPYEAAFGERDGPRFLKRVEPAYPLMARRLGKEGRVLLRLLIDGTGKLMEVEVVERAGFGFEGAAVEAVRRSSFRPAFRNGRSVISRSLLSVKFVLRDI